MRLSPLTSIPIRMAFSVPTSRLSVVFRVLCTSPLHGFTCTVSISFSFFGRHAGPLRTMLLPSTLPVRALVPAPSLTLPVPLFGHHCRPSGTSHFPAPLHPASIAPLPIGTHACDHRAAIRTRNRRHVQDSRHSSHSRRQPGEHSGVGAGPLRTGRRSRARSRRWARATRNDDHSSSTRPGCPGEHVRRAATCAITTPRCSSGPGRR